MNRKTRWAASACLALCTLLGLAAPAAQAGTYSVHSCRNPTDGPSPISDASGGWTHEVFPTADSGLRFTIGCPSDGFLTVDVGGITSWADPYIYSQMRFQPPSDTRIANFALEYQGYAVPGDASKVGFVEVSTDQNRYAYHPGEGTLNRRWLTVNGIDASWLVLHAGCQGGNVRCGGTQPGGDARAELVRSRITLSDDATPTGVAFGPPADATTWTTAQTLTIDTEDRGSGVYRVAFEVDGVRAANVPVDQFGGRCVESQAGRVFLYPRPCKLDPAAIDIALTPSAYAEGTHDVRVVIEDAAGNVRRVALGQKLFDWRPPVLDGAAAVAGTGREGDPLACTIGGISGQSPQVSYEWVRVNADGSGRTAIGGATTDSYTPVSADVGRKVLCRITASDAGGTVTSESALTSGPFADGNTVREICAGMPTGPGDPCGDLDSDGTRNRDDLDADGDGVKRDADPDDLNPAATGRDATTPSSVTTSTNTTTSTHTATTTETVRETLAIPEGPVGEINGRLGGPGASLSIHHEGTTSRTVRVSHGRRVVIEGRLRAPDGRGVEGARLEVSTQDRAAGSAFKPFGALLTGAEGAYKLILPAGPSRTVRVGYRARFGDASFAQTSDVTVLVKAGLQFRLTRSKLRNRRSVRYVGRLLGPRSGHRFVEVLVRVGRRWIVVCSVRTDAKGSYGCAHRFTKTFRRTRYVFRARVRRQSTLPYEPAVSRTRSLTVRP